MGDKIKKDIIQRLLHLPTTTMGFLIILIGLGLVGLGIIEMESFTGFCLVSLPFFFMKKGEKTEKE